MPAAAAEEAALILDADGRVTSTNRAAATLLGQREAALLGRPVGEILRLGRGDGSSRPTGCAPVDQALAGEDVPRRSHVYLRIGERGLPVEYAAVPVRRGGRVVGAVITLSDVSAWVAAERELRIQAEGLAAVARAVRELPTGPDARVRICEAARELADASVVLLLEPRAGGDLVSTAVTGAELAPIRVRVGLEPSGAGIAYTSREPFFVPEAKGHHAVSQRLVEETETVSALFQPILHGDAVSGVLVVIWRRRLRGLSDRAAGSVALLAAEAGTAIERADLLVRANALARTDVLTGLPNRRALEEELPRAMSRVRREGRPLFLAILDLDHFKAYNDIYGHQAGDRLLRAAAAAWRSQLRDFDVLVRHGGEEFALVVESRTREEAHEVVERVRAATPSAVTCSAGLAAWDGLEPPEALLARADRALYLAKGRGRNRTARTE